MSEFTYLLDEDVQELQKLRDGSIDQVRVVSDLNVNVERATVHEARKIVPNLQFTREQLPQENPDESLRNSSKNQVLIFTRSNS